MHFDLSDAETAALTKELDDITRNDRYPFSERIRPLKAILAKLRLVPGPQALAAKGVCAAEGNSLVWSEVVGITHPIAQRVCVGKLGKAGTRHGRALVVRPLVARRRLAGHGDFLEQHVGAKNAADERHQGEGGEADAPRQCGVAREQRRVDQPSEPSHAYKWYDRCRNRRAPNQH